MTKYYHKKIISSSSPRFSLMAKPHLHPTHPSNHFLKWRSMTSDRPVWTSHQRTRHQTCQCCTRVEHGRCSNLSMGDPVSGFHGSYCANLWERENQLAQPGVSRGNEKRIACCQEWLVDRGCRWRTHERKLRSKHGRKVDERSAGNGIESTRSRLRRLGIFASLLLWETVRVKCWSTSLWKTSWWNFWEVWALAKYPENLLVMLYTWQAGDCSGQEPYIGDFEKAMRSIKAQDLVLPAKTDLYFPSEDSDEVSSMIPGIGRCIEFPSIWGHWTGVTYDLRWLCQYQRC